MARSQPEQPAATPDDSPGGQRRGAGGRRRGGRREVRARLIEAAAKVVGERGYAGASIARITQEAGVAQGAFYLHFSSQQELFDILLPLIGDDMIDHIGRTVRDAGSLDDIETRGLFANVDYLADHPNLVRILREAEYFAPGAYHAFIDALARSRAAGEIRGFDENELAVVADMLMGARNFLIERHAMQGEGCAPLPDDVARTYLKFVLAGLKFADRIAPELSERDRGAVETADPSASPEVPAIGKGCR